MIANYLPIPDIAQAPEIVRYLRAEFDNRLEELYKEAMRMSEGSQDEQTSMVHVPFSVGDLEVEAMFDLELNLFTQLVARPLSDRENARPAYTISLFLVAKS